MTVQDLTRILRENGYEVRSCIKQSRGGAFEEFGVVAEPHSFCVTVLDDERNELCLWTPIRGDAGLPFRRIPLT